MKAIKILRTFILICACVCVCACSSNEDEQPETQLSDISGVWIEYAYLCSGGYFVDISGDENMRYEFERPNKFTKYTIDKTMFKDVYTQGEWTFDAKKGVAYVTEPRGWNLEIRFTFLPVEDGEYKARLDIKGKTNTSSSIVKVKRISQ
ncbi:MAG: hypothetical protein MR982_03300 [Bacteroides pyogenes]|uniref:hypothetical protein n=1 Tax=Bacteroides pyogenes TaxID=310300 RepID=UPI001BAE3ECE|nr:hypothetical protein [Bacteroides pyogenes]MBR8725486.1 hypothetical protein [Bacteroides pyogenes]MBR8737733.1 hypothetical protein [Bacteroides pyogenes]MBR8753221.1 hypothetical protein [Bacteroides pyogenes]MBR8794643.1 hypothetical protein [Bacteroides pyogenes]MCF2709966.1 hypothetical protein [Bacteroides pyogenes]